MSTWIPSKSSPSFKRHPDLKLENRIITDVYQWILKKQWKKESQCVISGNPWISIWFQSNTECHLFGFLGLISSRHQSKSINQCCPLEIEVHPSEGKHWSAVCDFGRELQYFYNNISTPFFPKTAEKPNHCHLQEGTCYMCSICIQCQHNHEFLAFLWPTMAGCIDLKLRFIKENTALQC